MGAVLLMAVPAWAYIEYHLTTGETVAGSVFLWMNGSSLAQPVSATAPLPVTATGSGSVTNPTSTTTRPANTTNYAQNNLVANNTVAASVVVGSVAIANTAGGVLIPRVRLATNKTSGWDAVVLRVRLWSAAPTYSNGDGGAYAVATGAAGLLGMYDCTLAQFADGASGFGVPSSGTVSAIKLASGTSIFYDLQYTGSAALTPASGQTFTITPEMLN
jgi:hypothetical protein